MSNPSITNLILSDYYNIDLSYCVFCHIKHNIDYRTLLYLHGKRSIIWCNILTIKYIDIFIGVKVFILYNKDIINKYRDKKNGNT